MKTGIITTKNGKFIFREHQGEYWAWEIKGNYSRGMAHKWKKLPEGEIEKFDIDNPPQTVTYLPNLD